MRDNLELKFGGNGYLYLFQNGRLVYKSKNHDKVKARYNHLVKLQESSEARISAFKENPYSVVR